MAAAPVNLKLVRGPLSLAFTFALLTFAVRAYARMDEDIVPIQGSERGEGGEKVKTAEAPIGQQPPLEKQVAGQARIVSQGGGPSAELVPPNRSDEPIAVTAPTYMRGPNLTNSPAAIPVGRSDAVNRHGEELARHAMPVRAPDQPQMDEKPEPPQVVQTVASVEQALDQGDKDNARVILQQALQQYPDSPRLKQLDALTAPKKLEVDQPKLAQRIKALLFNRDPGAVADAVAPQPQLASPVGALLAAAAPRPAALPAPASLPASAPLQLRQSLPQKTLLAMQIGDYPQAEKNLTETIAADPQNYVAWRLRGLTRYYEQKLPDASADADHALSINPGDSPSHWIKALVNLDSGKPAQAKQEADAALRLDPRNADALVTRGQALDKLGRPDDALADYQKAAELDPQLASIYHRALAQRGADSKFEALSRTRALYLAAAGLALLFLGLSFFVKRGATTVRAAAAPMRSEDRHPDLGGFRILRRVGQGGMGIVYEAFDESLHRRVALKRMRDEIAADPRERRRFIKEARTVAALRHPGIVEIFSIVEQDEALYLVFEFLHGQPLDELMEQRGGRLSPAEVLPLAKQVAEALDYAHTRGVIHQDLKPANIVVESGQAKVMDFGIARRVQETLSTIGRAEVAGTPAYMAPEQERGLASPAADLYAFGACLYQLLSGQMPFSPSGGSLEKLERKYVPLSKLAGLAPSVDRIIDRALDPEPSKRPATARDLVAALEAALSLPRA